MRSSTCVKASTNGRLPSVLPRSLRSTLARVPAALDTAGVSHLVRVPLLGGPSPRVFAALAILALLQPALTSFAPELAGWRPDHAHLSLAANGAHTHEHPYERVPGASEDTSAAEDAPGVVFLSPDQGATANVVLAPAIELPASIEAVPAPREAPLAVLPQGATHPEPPPPRS
jgi:hypothetical protein